MTIQEVFSHYISYVSLGISLISVCFVYIQVRYRKKQLLLSNYEKIIAINRELIKMGFDDEVFFDILDGKTIESQQKHGRYIQLWLNQIDYIFLLKKSGMLNKEGWYSLDNDIRDFMSIESVKSHWYNVKQYYGRDLAKYLDEIIRQNLNKRLTLRRSPVVKR